MRGPTLRCVQPATPRRLAVWALRCRCGSVYAEGSSREAVEDRLLERHRQLIPLCRHRNVGVEVVA